MVEDGSKIKRNKPILTDPGSGDTTGTTTRNKKDAEVRPFLSANTCYNYHASTIQIVLPVLGFQGLHLAFSGGACSLLQPTRNDLISV